MHLLKENLYLIVTIIVIFAITLAGAVFSPTFSEQKSFLELFVLMGGLLFVFSLLVILATIGFRSFALYLALFLAVTMALLGIEATLLVIILTYLVWGLGFGIELLLLDNGVESAMGWFKERYDFKSFRLEYYTFYPMIIVLYILIEFLPNLLYKEPISRFSPVEIFEKMKNILDKKS